MKSTPVGIKYSYVESHIEGVPGHHRYVFTFRAPAQGHLEIIPVEFDVRDPRDEKSDKQAVHQFEAQAFEYGDIEWQYNF